MSNHHFIFSIHKILKSISVSVFVLLIVFCSFVLPCSYVQSANTDKMDYSLSCDNYSKNKNFSVNLNVSGIGNIAAVEIALEFDQSYIEFMSISDTNNAFEVEHIQSDCRVSVIILCSYGYQFNGTANLMTFKFRSVRDGDTGINLTVKDPVDKNCDSLAIGNVYGIKLGFSGDKITASKVKENNKSLKYGRNNKLSKSDDSSEDYENRGEDPEIPDKSDETLEDNTDNSIDIEGYNLVDNNDDTYMPYFIGGLIALIIFLIIIISYKIGRQNKSKDDEKE